MPVGSREELKEYCFRALGWPVVQINVDEDQVNDRIDEAFQYYQQFHYDATRRTYLQHQLTSTDITNRYIPISANIIGVTRVFSLGSSNSTANMFDIRYQMRLQDIQSLTSASMQTFVITQQYLSMLDMLLVGQTPIEFSRHTDQINLWWDWEKRAVPGQYLIFEVMEIIDPDTYTKVYNDRMLKHYATALIKKQWGINMKKFGNVQLPGGVFMRGQETYDEAIAEIKEIEESIRLEFELPPMMTIG